MSGPSIAVGFLAAPEGDSFNWEVASIFGTALGTTALAGFTGALAFTTSGDVRATWELAKLTRDDQEARERPVVLLQRAEWKPDPRDDMPDAYIDSGTLEIELRNVALGPALRLVVEAQFADEDYPADPITPGIFAALLPGEAELFKPDVKFSNLPPTGIRGDRFPVRGTYTDRAQRREYQVITEWQSAPTMEWNDPGVSRE